MPQIPQQGQPTKKRNKALVVVLAIVLVLLLAAAAWAIYFFGPSKKPGSLTEQWAQLKTEVPNGQIAAMEWRAGPLSQDRWETVDWLELYWLESDGQHYLTKHPFDADESGASGLQRPGYQNHDVTEEALSRFQEFIDSIACEKDQYRAARMLFLNDGTPIFAGGCDTGYNTNAMSAWPSYVIDGQTRELTTWDGLVAASLEISEHMGIEAAVLELASGGDAVTASSCVRAKCGAQLAVRANLDWPAVQIAPEQDPFTWDPVLASKMPAGIPSGYLTTNSVDKQKFNARLEQFATAGFPIDKSGYLSHVVAYQDGFAMSIYHRGDLVLVDQNGNVLNG